MPEQDNPLIDALNQMKEPKIPGQALQHNHESFPVLKAFHEYLEAERRKMRQRTMVIAAVATAASLAILVTLVVAGMFLLSGTNASQDRLLEAQYRMVETMMGLSQNQNRPIPAPVVPASVAQEFENRMSGEFGRMVENLTKLMESMQSDVKTSVADVKSTVAAEQTFESSKVFAVMLDVQEQLKSINDEINILRTAPPAPAQPPPVVETVNPVRPSTDFPELAARWEQQNRQAQQTQPAAPAPGINEIQPRPLGVASTRPIAVIDPNLPAAQEAAPAPRATPAASPDNPLKLEFSNTPGQGAQPATLALPAPGGAPVTWRLVVPAEK